MAFTRPTTDRGPARAPVTLDLPEPASLGRMLGPGIIAVGIGMAAGELILWPYITALAGFGLLWLALATVYLVWGSTYLAIRVMVETVPPLLGAGLRFLLAGAVLYPFLVARRGWAAVRVPAAQVGASALVGLLFLAGGTGLVTVAERDVPSGLAAVLVAAMPLVVVVLRRLAGEPVPRATAIGVTVGFAGVAVLVLPGNPTPGSGGLGLGLILVATVSMAVASFVSSRLPVPGDTLIATALELLAAGVELGHDELLARMGDVEAAEAVAGLPFLERNAAAAVHDVQIRLRRERPAAPSWFPRPAVFRAGDRPHLKELLGPGVYLVGHQ